MTDFEYPALIDPLQSKSVLGVTDNQYPRLLDPSSQSQVPTFHSGNTSHFPSYSSQNQAPRVTGNQYPLLHEILQSKSARVSGEPHLSDPFRREGNLYVGTKYSRLILAGSHFRQYLTQRQ